MGLNWRSVASGSDACEMKFVLYRSGSIFSSSNTLECGQSRKEASVIELTDDSDILRRTRVLSQFSFDEYV